MLSHRLLSLSGDSGSFVPPQGTIPPFDASWTRSGSNPILTATETWEDTAVIEAMVLYESGWKMWYRGGWSTQATGYATSSDGINWTKYGSNPVYGQGGSSMAGNDGGQPWVTKVGSTFYLYATNNDVPRVNVATSTDGIAWTTQTSSISLPALCTLWGNRVVWIESGTWYMIAEAYRLGTWMMWLYTSSDGLSWTIANGGSSLVSLQIAPSSAFGGPRFASDATAVLTPTFSGTYHLWYHANATGANLPTNIYHATSSDKINWTVAPGTPVLTLLGSGFEIDQVAGPCPVVVAGTAYLFYDGDDNATSSAAIGVATALAT